ncbi:alpha-L-fucosidase, partial [Streptomyces sp. SID8455]|nr:alpha-L-fucosidase [Streptomyces sp. SID8455]
LTSLVRDTAADGGNLLLNVGPRGEDATIPAEQQLRLGWLAEETASGSLTPERTPGRSAPE